MATVFIKFVSGQPLAVAHLSIILLTRQFSTLFSRANSCPAIKQTLWTAKNYKHFQETLLWKAMPPSLVLFPTYPRNIFFLFIYSSSILLWHSVHFMTVCPKDVGSMFIQNFVTFLPDYTALYRRKGWLLGSTVRTPNPASDVEDSSVEV